MDAMINKLNPSKYYAKKVQKEKLEKLMHPIALKIQGLVFLFGWKKKEGVGGILTKEPSPGPEPQPLHHVDYPKSNFHQEPLFQSIPH